MKHTILASRLALLLQGPTSASSHSRSPAPACPLHTLAPVSQARVAGDVMAPATQLPMLWVCVWTCSYHASPVAVYVKDHRPPHSRLSSLACNRSQTPRYLGPRTHAAPSHTPLHAYRHIIALFGRAATLHRVGLTYAPSTAGLPCIHFPFGRRRPLLKQPAFWHSRCKARLLSRIGVCPTAIESAASPSSTLGTSTIGNLRVLAHSLLLFESRMLPGLEDLDHLSTLIPHIL